MGHEIASRPATDTPPSVSLDPLGATSDSNDAKEIPTERPTASPGEFQNSLETSEARN